MAWISLGWVKDGWLEYAKEQMAKWGRPVSGSTLVRRG